MNNQSDPLPVSEESGHRRGFSALLPRERLHVLIVDDNKDLVQFVTTVLRGSCAVVSAQDGRRGLELLRASRLDLAIVDVAMPGMDGFELLERIRSDAEVRTVPVIMLSGDSSEEARLQALAGGADDYLVKPFKPKELLARIHAHVGMVRLRREAFLREGELLQQIGEIREDLDSVLEHTNDAVIVLDPRLCVLTLNRAGSALLDVPIHSAAGRSLHELIPAVTGGALEAGVRQALSTGEVVVLEHHQQRTDRWFGVRCYPARHGITLFGADITEQKRSEAAVRAAQARLEERVDQRTAELRSANQLLSAIFDQAPSGMALLDSSSRHLRTNDAYRLLVSISDAALTGAPLATVVHADHVREMDFLLADLASGRRETGNLEIRYRRSDGTPVWVKSFLSAIRDPEGRLVCFVKVVHDISGRKDAEQTLMRSQRQLRELYHRLEEVREDERLLLAREVHDQLGQMLSAAKIDIKLLEDSLRRDARGMTRRMMIDELRSARGIIEKAIQTARAIAQELRPPELEDHGLYEAIRTYAEEFERRTRTRCCVVIAKGPAEPVGAPATALFRIFQEAMTNIMRHAQATEVCVDLVMRGQWRLLRILDNGVGISRSQGHGGNSLGIRGMRERAAIARGHLRIGRVRGKGTLVAVRVCIDDMTE